MSPAVSSSRLLSVFRTGALPVLDARGWEHLLSDARARRLAARLATLAQRQGWLTNVPDGPRQHLQWALTLASRERRQAQWEIDRIRAALLEVGVKFVLLKGGAYVAKGLPPADGRLFGDVDVLVSKAQMPVAEAQLMAHGWVAKQLDPYDQRYYRSKMHEAPPLKHVWRHTWVDLHHAIAPPTSRFPVDGPLLLESAVPLDHEGLAHVLAPHDMVLHSALHLMMEGDFHTALRDLLDINDLLAHFHAADPHFWAGLVARAEALKVTLPTWHVMRQVHRLFDTPMPRAILVDLKPVTRWSWQLMPALLDRVVDAPSAPGAGTSPKLARELLYIRSHWIRMPPWMILRHLATKAAFRLRHRMGAS